MTPKQQNPSFARKRSRLDWALDLNFVTASPSVTASTSALPLGYWPVNTAPLQAGINRPGFCEKLIRCLK